MQSLRSFKQLLMDINGKYITCSLYFRVKKCKLGYENSWKKIDTWLLKYYITRHPPPHNNNNEKCISVRKSFFEIKDALTLVRNPFISNWKFSWLLTLKGYVKYMGWNFKHNYSNFEVIFFGFLSFNRKYTHLSEIANLIWST